MKRALSGGIDALPMGRAGSTSGIEFVMTDVGPLPMPRASSDALAQEPATSPENSMDAQSRLRISGQALARLASGSVASSGRTWPKSRDGAQRPPLPWKPDTGAEDAETSASTRTWRGTVHAQPRRPSVFEVFDINRPAGPYGGPGARHQSVFEAFGAGEGARQDSRQDSGEPGMSQAGSGSRLLKSRSSSRDQDDSSPDVTWTAGMTGDRAPPELAAALKRNSSAPHLAGEGPTMTERPSSSQTSPRKVSEEADAGEPARSEEATPSDQADVRSRLVVGLKRYFHSKRIEGLLSSRGLRILDNACDAAIEDPFVPLALWETLEKDSTGTLVVNTLAHQVHAWRKAIIWLRRRRVEEYRFGIISRRALAWPLKQAIGIGHGVLSRFMLIGIEVALEYMLALTYSPQVLFGLPGVFDLLKSTVLLLRSFLLVQVQLLSRQGASQGVLHEAQQELDRVWKFILDREIEAPERFQAIQSYRATMAVLNQQVIFVKQLFDSGVIDDQEREEMLRCWFTAFVQRLLGAE